MYEFVCKNGPAFFMLKYGLTADLGGRLGSWLENAPPRIQIGAVWRCGGQKFRRFGPWGARRLETPLKAALVTIYCYCIYSGADGEQPLEDGAVRGDWDGDADLT